MRKAVILLLSFIMIASCSKIYRDKPVDKSRLLGEDYRLFQDTPAWELAKAVWDNDISKIDREVKKNPQLLNYQESLYGLSLLHTSSYRGQFKSFKELLRLGANPNIYDSVDCRSPIIQCCLDFDDKTKYVAELIKYGANVNDVECGKGRNLQKTEFTPIAAAAGYSGNLRMVKLLVEKGAVINDNSDESILGGAVIQGYYDIVLYLLQQGADCNKILYRQGMDVDNLTDIYMKDRIMVDKKLRASKEYPQIIEIMRKRGCL